MRTTDRGDAARIELLLAELRLPAIKQVWAALAAQADKEGWPAGRFLAALAEHEVAERGRRRLERHLAEARLPPGKTLDTFDFEAVPVISKAQVMALAAGDTWLSERVEIGQSAGIELGVGCGFDPGTWSPTLRAARRRGCAGWHGWSAGGQPQTFSAFDPDLQHGIDKLLLDGCDVSPAAGFCNLSRTTPLWCSGELPPNRR
jgi:hypothetical protein